MRMKSAGQVIGTVLVFYATASSAQTLPNIAALRANTSISSLFNVLGYATASDGGQGQFTYNPADTKSSDNGGTIIVDAAGHRWHRQFSGALNVLWFGAKCDGSTVDTTPIALAETYVESLNGGEILFPGYCVATVTVAGNNIHHIGLGPTSSAAVVGSSGIVAPSLTASAVTVGHVSGYTIQNLQLRSMSQQTSGALLAFNNTIDSNIYDVVVVNGYDNILLANTSIVRLRGGESRNFSHRALYITGQTNVQPGGGNDIYVEHWVANEDTSAYAPWAGIEIDQNGGSVTLGPAVDVLHGHNDLLIDPGAGSYVDWVYTDAAYFDSCDFPGSGETGGIGIDIAPIDGGIVNGGSFANTWSSTCTFNVAIQPDSASRASGAKFTNFESVNAFDQAFYLKNATDVVISNSVIAGASQSSIGTYAGIEIDGGSNNIGISNSRVGATVEGYGPTMKFGLQIDPGFNGTLNVDGLNASGNAIAGLFNASSSTGITIENSAGVNPLGTSSVTPTPSPWVYKAGVSPETLILAGGTVSAVRYAGGYTICTATPCQVALAPNQSVRITYTLAPTAIANRQ